MAKLAQRLCLDLPDTFTRNAKILAHLFQCAGPAIIESDTTTVLLLAGDVARMDGRGWLVVTLPEEG